MAAQPIVHVEIPSTDSKAAGAFYAKVFGWQVAAPPGMEFYPMFQASGGPGGGFTTVGDGMPGETRATGEVVVYLASEDIDADLQRIQSNGGETLVAKMEVPGPGWIAIFRDPFGNKVGLFMDNRQPG
ncbi:MAG TPA: VOC family protein [Chloroflexota bacterium]|nr:VOC family protein [Chloroflexota bacterium]